jgi:hypothetical protein
MQQQPKEELAFWWNPSFPELFCAYGCCHPKEECSVSGGGYVRVVRCPPLDEPVACVVMKDHSIHLFQHNGIIAQDLDCGCTLDVVNLALVADGISY